MVRIKVQSKQTELLKKVLSLILEAAKIVNIKNQNGETPLHQACLEGSYVTVKWLLDNGADVCAVTKHRETPFHFACRSGNKDAVSLLLKAGADPDADVCFSSLPFLFSFVFSFFLFFPCFFFRSNFFLNS